MDEAGVYISNMKKPYDYNLKCPWRNFADCLKLQCPFYQWMPGAFVIKEGEEEITENYIPIYGCKRAGFTDTEMKQNDI